MQPSALEIFIAICQVLASGLSDGGNQCTRIDSLNADILNLAFSLQDDYSTEPFTAKTLKSVTQTEDLRVTEEDVARDLSEYLKGYEFKGKKSKVQYAINNVANLCERIETTLGNCFEFAKTSGQLQQQLQQPHVNGKQDNHHQRALIELAKVNWCRIFVVTKDKDSLFFKVTNKAQSQKRKFLFGSGTRKQIE